MRALAQGLDERASWDRYLRLEGEHTDLRTVRRTIAWIRDEFAAAAKRERKPGTARLILLDPDRLPAAPTLPSLAEFAEAQGLEDFSEDEQIEAYEAAYPSARQGGGGRGGANGQASRRARLIERQLEALRWLQDLEVRDPRPGDSVGAWLNPSLAIRLERAGVPTIHTLVDRINGIGARWWLHVPGVGELKAARIVQWLQAYESVLGLRVGAHATQPRKQLSAAALAAVVPATAAIVPYEKFASPTALDGRHGEFRAPQDACRLLAVNDHEALGAWLAAKRPGDGSADLSATQRSYRKEAERLLLWSVLERRKALSSLSAVDAEAYLGFLAAPPASWCGPRHHQRWSPMWRPLEGSLSRAAQRQALVILRSMFTYLIENGYVVGNPFAAVAPPLTLDQPRSPVRTLTPAQWKHLDTLLQAHGDTEIDRRLRRGMRWIYATGLRLGEITRAKCEDLEQPEHRQAHDEKAPGWLLHVQGTRGHARRVSVPCKLVEELSDELVRHGFEASPRATSNRGMPVMARFDIASERPTAWSASGLYQAIKRFLAHAAEGLDEAEATQLKEASTHWLRHAEGRRAAGQGWEGPRAGMHDHGVGLERP
ncbi:Site-specific recombinase XerD [Variovorax sp. HW608]|uniref:site-specific integrase n=1 Tax=Variovorax sp. HW608 TaxID=1034889 RepID=UPI00081F88F7|nr:site-specific integrase [Variovorax sp. HW608]SCK09355.1 Site-specific recombinase XerD [Variovorax sp. HW608]